MKNIEKKRVTFILGTRPEAIKMAPIIKIFNKDINIYTRVVNTGQHFELISQVLNLFSIKEDLNLSVMKKNQTLSYFTSEILNGLQREFINYRPDLVLVQGDTTSSFSGALAAFYEKIPIGHIEAGLRTNNIFDPYPEEVNRRLISQLASLNFAPTEKSKKNLDKSKVNGEIYITGNTVIDAFLSISEFAKRPKIEGVNWSENRIIPDLVRSYMSKKSAIIRNPKSIRPWSYVLDIIIGYLIIGLDCIEKKPSFNSYNLSPLQKSSFTVLDLANKFLNKFDKRNPVVVDDLVEFKEKKFLKLSSNKIYKELNWSNQISFEDTVKLTAQWYQKVLSGLSPLKVTENNIKDYLQILNTKEKIYAS